MKKLLTLKRSLFPVFKYDLKMKLFTLSILAALFSMQANDAYGQRAKVTLDLNNVTVKQLIDEIESKAKFEFVYKIKDVNLDRIVSIKVDKQRIAKVLKKVFQNTYTTYNLNNRRIYLLKRANAEILPIPEKSDSNIGMQFSINGTVTDENGQPLPGASVIEKGTNNGTQTDFDGNFEISVSDLGAVLLISYLGYQSQEISLSLLDEPSKILVQMDPNTSELDEIVVTGSLIATTKKQLGNAISSLTTKGVVQASTPNVTAALSGKIPGALVAQNSGNPGGCFC